MPVCFCLFFFYKQTNKNTHIQTKQNKNNSKNWPLWKQLPSVLIYCSWLPEADLRKETMAWCAWSACVIQAVLRGAPVLSLMSSMAAFDLLPKLFGAANSVLDQGSPLTQTVNTHPLGDVFGYHNLPPHIWQSVLQSINGRKTRGGKKAKFVLHFCKLNLCILLSYVLYSLI